VREEELAEAMEAESTEKPKEKRGREKYMDQLLLPEPLVDIPSDLEVNWYAVPVPHGTRCLVISSRGGTISRRQNGSILDRFTSDLPSGSNKSRGDYCILDCIFHESSSTYFVLDILCWKGYSLYNCSTDFRFYWKITKLEETTVSVQSPRNPYKFVPLHFHACDAHGLRAALEGDPQCAQVIFYSKETDYTLGFTPLVFALDAHSEEGEKLKQRMLSGEIDAMQ